MAGAVVPSYFKGFNPLRFILTSMGINVERLVEGSRKCVTEVGPDAMGAMGAVKALLVSEAPATSLGAPPSLGEHPLTPDRATLLSAPVGTGRTGHI